MIWGGLESVCLDVPSHGRKTVHESFAKCRKDISRRSDGKASVQRKGPALSKALTMGALGT